MNPNDKDTNDTLPNTNTPPAEPVPNTNNLNEPAAAAPVVAEDNLVASAEPASPSPMLNTEETNNSAAPSATDNLSPNTPAGAQSNDSGNPTTPAGLPAAPLGGSSLPAATTGPKSKKMLTITLVVLGVLVLLVVLGMVLA